MISDKLQCRFELCVFKVLQLVSWSWVLDPSLFDPRWHCLGAESGIFSREMRGKITILNSILASQRWKKLMMHSKNVTICRLSNLAFIQTGIQTTIRFLFGSVDRSINIFMNNFIYFMPLYWSPSLVGLINDDVRNYDLVDCLVNRLHTKYG